MAVGRGVSVGSIGGISAASRSRTASGPCFVQQIIPVASAALDAVEGRRDQHAVTLRGPLLDLGRDPLGCVRSVVIDQHDVDAAALRLRPVGDACRSRPEVTERGAGTHKRNMQRNAGAISNENNKLQNSNVTGAEPRATCSFRQVGRGSG